MVVQPATRSLVTMEFNHRGAALPEPSQSRRGGGGTRAHRPAVFSQADGSRVPTKLPRFSARIPASSKYPLSSFQPMTARFVPSRLDLSRFFLGPSNSTDGRGNPAFCSGKPHVTKASQRKAKGRRPLQGIRKCCHLWQNGGIPPKMTPQSAQDPRRTLMERLFLK